MAKYPNLGPDFDALLPFNGGDAEFTAKASKTIFEIKTDGNHSNREAIISYKNTTNVTGYFNTIASCKLKGDMAAPANLSCKAGGPINVKLTIKGQGTDLEYLDIGL